MTAILKGAMLALGLLLILGSASASGYAFGTKVLSGDSDFGSPLSVYGLPNPAPSFSIRYWETGVVAGYDDTDVVYLHQGLGAVVLANDVRLTPFGNYPAGSKVTPQDNDIGQSPLTPIPTVTGGTPAILWANLYGGPGHDLDDPVYIHQGTYAAGIATTTNDVRLTAIGGKEPGTKVGNLDQDLPKIFSPPVPPNSPDPIVAGGLNPTPAGFFSRIRYVDINGNGQYDYPDDVYLITGAFPAFPAEPVKVNDVRLSGPAC